MSSSSSSSSSNMPRVDCSGFAAGRCSRAGSGSGTPPPPAVPGALPCVAAFRACSAFFNRLLASMFSASNSSASLAASAAFANAFVFKAALLSRSHVGTPHARSADVSVKLPGSQCSQFATHTGKAGAGRLVTFGFGRCPHSPVTNLLIREGRCSLCVQWVNTAGVCNFRRQLLGSARDCRRL